MSRRDMVAGKEYLNSALYWYPRLWDLPTPRTAVAFYDHAQAIHALEDDDEDSDFDLPISEVQTLAAEIGYPVFIRTDMASAKHHGPDAYRADSPEDVGHILWEAVEDNEMKFWLGEESPRAFLIREWLDISYAFKAFGGHPIGEEWRLFASGREEVVLCSHYYWPEDSIRFYGIEEPKVWRGQRQVLEEMGFPAELRDQAVTAARRCWHHDAWSVDFARDEDGKWWLIDMALAEASWHPEHPGEEDR